MALVMVGANPRRAPFLSLSRAFAEAAVRRRLLDGLREARCIDEAMLVAGADRLEIYAVIADGADGYDLLMAALAAAARVADAPRTADAPRAAEASRTADAAAHGCFAEGADAAGHLFAALESLDDRDALDDLARALVAAAGEARAAGTFGPVLEHLATAALGLGRRLGASEEGPSAEAVAETAVELARRVFEHLDRRQVLVIGRNSSAAALAEALYRAGAADISFLGADDDAECARGLGVRVVEPEGLSVLLGGADIVVVAAAPVRGAALDKRLVRGAVRARRGRAMLLLDVSEEGGAAVEPRVADVDDAFLYSQADLEALTRDAPWAQAGRASSREALVARETDAFALWLAG